MGTKLILSTAFYLQMDGQVKRTIQKLVDMLWVCVIDYSGNWIEHLSFVDLAYNNSYHYSIGMAPFKVLYSRTCRSSIR